MLTRRREADTVLLAIEYVRWGFICFGVQCKRGLFLFTLYFGLFHNPRASNVRLLYDNYYGIADQPSR